ncbi:MAG TPA: 23S rRNA (uracil(1939)-C(5))-methyltransferase RlmD [Chitinophagaceae bacterium]|nr:23S rRNA (uracil(1939)-C(5))-methyltransferase RlmD [Chitinophagaceae bacterium]HAN39537.1 23S rRNA (uracil(1939)-C(5))-methyltransferase RlmD [Chitinophagaceae bacterium]
MYFCAVKRRTPPIVITDVLVEDYAAEGKSLGRVDGKVIFIEQAVPGDIVDVKLTKNKKDWAEGYPLTYKKYSEQRATPFCSHFGVCGGCQWQMLPYEQQLQYKHRQVVDAMTRIAKLPPASFEMHPIVGCEATTEYRNKMEYTYATRKFIPKEAYIHHKQDAEAAAAQQQQPAAGFHAKGMFDKVVEIDTCHLQAAPTNDIRKFIANFCIEAGIAFYDIKEHQGFIRNVMVRTATTGQLMVNVIVGYDQPKLIMPLLQAVQTAFPQITTLLYTVNTKRNDSIFDLTPVVFSGNGYIEETLENYRFTISPKSFFQTNSKQAEVLYRITRDMAGLTGKETLYDLYCGTGSIGIFCSSKAAKVIGVEVVEQAIEDAKVNAQRNQLEHTHFYAGDVIDVCNDAFFELHGKPDVVITDPPRAGMHEKLIHKLLQMEAPTIVYVSCNPATQARDIQLLAEKYQVVAMQPVDMFPHTLHIENVALLTLR